MNNRRTFLWKVIYIFLLAVFGPAFATKLCGNPVSPALMGYKMATKWKEGVIYAPYMPLMVTDTINLAKNLKCKWSKEDVSYLSKAQVTSLL